MWPSVCYYSTGPVTLFHLGNNGFKALRALYVNQLGSRITVFEDNLLSSTT